MNIKNIFKTLLTSTLCTVIMSLGTLSVSAASQGLKIGDGNVSTTQAKKGYIFTCSTASGGGGSFKDGNWIKDGYWYPDLKPTVDGSIAWDSASVAFSTTDSKRIITGNGLPKGSTTGIYPIASTDDAYQYDRNPNTISSQKISFELPLNPTTAKTPTCLNMGIIGIMTNGVPMFSGLDAENRDAAAHEILDVCGGHPERSGQYHYHNNSECLTKSSVKKQKLIGYALDGFGIYTMYDDKGKKLTNASLDECHGITSTITWNGKKTKMYHYVMTQEYPYSLGCYKGTAVKVSSTTQGGSGMMPPPGTRPR